MIKRRIRGARHLVTLLLVMLVALGGVLMVLAAPLQPDVDLSQADASFWGEGMEVTTLASPSPMSGT